MTVNKYHERVSPYDLVANWRQDQRILARKRAAKRLARAESKKDPYTPPRTKVLQSPST